MDSENSFVHRDPESRDTRLAGMVAHREYFKAIVARVG